MTSERVSPLVDNWAYLRVELGWLDRLLRVAVARQRQEKKEVDQVAKSTADKVTSHWWKGLITLEGPVGQDDRHQPQAHIPGLTRPVTKPNYQQQLDARIEASVSQGIVLGLPTLRHRLGLTLFEKNLIILSLAPEINNRYSQLYNYLQGEEKTNLPTLDLILRLLCRSDNEWRDGRMRLSCSPLVELGLVELLGDRSPTILGSPVKLCDRLVNYLLSEVPDAGVLETLVAGPSVNNRLSSQLQWQKPKREWSNLVLPPALHSALQQLCQQWQLHPRVEEAWGFASQTKIGTVILFSGASGTGKTAAAEAIACCLQTSLASIDLALVDPTNHQQLLAEVATASPTVLLVKSAFRWLGRNSTLTSTQINQFLHQRQSFQCITLMSVERGAVVRASLARQFDMLLEFPLPKEGDRLQLWKLAFPPQVPLDPEIDWPFLAKKWRLSGGEIEAIARQAAFYAAAENPATFVRMEHLIRAIEQKIPTLRVRRSPRSLPDSR